MRHILAVPTWLLTRMLVPYLPKKHPWYKKKFTLDDWTRGATKITLGFGIVIWLNSALIIAMLILI